MKKIINKIKKIFSIIGVCVISMSTKVFALEPSYELSHEPELYGVPSTSSTSVSMIWKIARNFVIPIILLIGLIIYLKKSKSSKKKKILVIIGIIVLIAILYFVVK